jgi:23S rRNA (guanosine2251-2'-O)-methyltransferase
MKLNARQLRDMAESEQPPPLKRRPIYLILENVYDTYNVGGLFRLADALAVSKIYLCGQTEIPPNAKIKKASIGTYKIVPWEYKKTAAEAISDLRSQISDLKVIAIEQDSRAVDFRDPSYDLPLALLVGNETSGVTEETLRLVDEVVEIPMWGINKSLNVIVSAAIISYWVIRDVEV